MLSLLQVETAKSLIDDWNDGLEEMVKLTEAHNEDFGNQYREGHIHPETLLDGLLPLPSKVKHPTESWARWWKSAWGWSVLSRSADEGSTWLPYSHHDMVQSREEFSKLMSEQQVNPLLILNYDQVWRNCFSIGRTPLMYKEREKGGDRAEKTRVGPKADKKMHAIRGARRSITVPWHWYLKCMFPPG